MKVLIIGFGSIGKRHFEILSAFENVNSVDVVSKQKLEDIPSYSNLENIEDLNIYNYFIIASETVKHFEQLNYICSKVQHKKILVEKPLYDKLYEKIETTNQISTAYNLRFHPVLEKLGDILRDEDIYYVNVICGQYLPTWRPEQDYRDSYSADINQGGGVLRDLSHELDYIIWLFGDIKKIDAINTKVSDLEINSDDIFTAIAISDRKIIINLSIDYISKTPMRRLIVHTQISTIEADLITNTIVVSDKNSNSKNIECKIVDRNYTYTKMHEAILNSSYENVCSFDEGYKIIDVIENVEFKEL